MQLTGSTGIDRPAVSIQKSQIRFSHASETGSKKNQRRSTEDARAARERWAGLTERY
jgi:hypothetical protein